MALPKILERLFELGGFGQYLYKDIIPNHEDIHRFDGRDPVQIDAGQIITGVISPYRLPDSVKERSIRVKNEAAMLALTTDQVQNGDNVLVSETGVWYTIVDDTRLDKKSGYLKFGTVNISDTGEIGKAETANRLAVPIRLILTGVNGISDPWDGSTNLTVDITSIDPDLLNLHNPITYLSNDYTVTKEHANNIFCCNREITLYVDTDGLSNGWYFYVKNTSNSLFCTITGLTASSDDNTEEPIEGDGDNNADENIDTETEDTEIESSEEEGEITEEKDEGGDSGSDDSDTPLVSNLLFENLPEYKVPPLITVKFVFDGANFIAISNAPIITDGKVKL